jgi:hypothetical protein
MHEHINQLGVPKTADIDMLFSVQAHWQNGMLNNDEVTQQSISYRCSIECLEFKTNSEWYCQFM